MKANFLFAVAVAALLAGCGDDNPKKSAQATNAPVRYDTGNPLTAPADYVGAVMQADKFAVKSIDISYLSEAIQQFNIAEGRFPKTLDELVPNYVGKLPATPYGTKLSYDAATGTVKVVKQ
jgi:hypothetical protein